MFDKLKQLGKLKEIKASLSQEEVKIEKGGMMIIMDGNLEIKEISLNAEINKEEQERILKECFNEGIKQVQIKMMGKFKGMM